MTQAKPLGCAHMRLPWTIMKGKWTGSVYVQSDYITGNGWPLLFKM